MKKNETKKSIKNIVCLEGALSNIYINDKIIRLSVVVENTKGHSFIPVIVFKDSYTDFEQLTKDLKNIEIKKYDKDDDGDYFTDYCQTLERVYIEGELNSNTYKGNTTIQVIANVVK